MMSSKCLFEDERMQYDKEFSKFLIQRIEQAGGSMQIQHLTGLLQQARFEIRDAFGATKRELMKFLKARPNVFQIDPMGIVTVTTSSMSYESSHDIDTNGTAENKKPLIPKIENGTGLIIKLHPEFGIIKATEPVETEIHFKSQAFSNNKDSLLSDCGLKIQDEVSFNAEYGHDDYDIKFRASKVWLKSNEYENIHERHFESEGVIQKDISSERHFEGEGVIRELSSNVGYISVVGKGNEIVYFHKASVKDCTNIELTKIFKVGDPVEFSASKQKDITQWKAIVVRKKLKRDNAQSSHTKTKITDDTFKKRIENEPGKICPRSNGAIIKFGENFSEQADGNSSTYFWYGTEVSDIAFEFSEGDDVWFNAISTKSAPGWKAILVWVGEKPICVNNKKILDEKTNEFSNDKSCASSSNFSSVSDNSSLRPKTVRCKSNVSTTEQVILKTNDKSQSFDHSGNRKNQTGGGYIKQKSKLSKSLQSSSAIKSKKEKGRIELEKTNKNEGKQYRTVAKNELLYKPERKTSSIHKHIDARYSSDREFCEISDFCDDDCEDYLSCKDDMSDTSQDNIEDDDIQTSLKYKSFVSASKYSFSGSDEDDIDSTCNEIETCKSTDKKEPSIQKFEDVDGEIITLYCKAAIIKSPHLLKNIDFVLNAFYLNGKSVEEQQVIDLKEIIKVGDKVKFNCFEIIDDSGEIHQKVTMAWTGLKPKVYEMTPEEFINDYDLSVTVSDELVTELVPKHRTVPQNFLTVVPNLEETLETTLQNSSDDMSDNEMFRQSKTSETQIRENLAEKELLLDTHELSKIIIQRLKSKGLISLDLQVDVTTSVLTEIISIVQKHCSDSECNSLTLNEEIGRNSKDISQAVCFTCGEKKSKTLSGKCKTDKHAAVQTIITGGIIAQNESFLGKFKSSEIH